MAVIVNPANFNPSALTAPGVYLEVTPPQNYVPGAPASVSFVEGTASWGPVNSPQLIGNVTTLNSTYMTITAASASDIHDLATDVVVALNQAGQSGLSLWCNRVTDGTDVAASAILPVSQASALVEVVVGGTITSADVVGLAFTYSGFSGGHEYVTYTVQSSDTVATVAAGLTAAINADSVLTAASITASHTTGSPDIFITIPGPTVIPVVTAHNTGTPSETLTITTTDPIPGGTLQALYTGVGGNQIVATVLANSVNTQVNVLLTAWAGKSQEFYTGLPNTSGFWAALQNALAQGTGSTQGPSQLARFIPATHGSPGAPALGALTLTGGTDGRSVTTSNLIGSSAAVPPTGIYTAATVSSPAIQQLWIAGFTDATGFPSLDEFAQQNGVAACYAFPFNTSITSAITIMNTAGISDYQAFAPLDWILFYDSINGVQRFIPPYATAMGVITALSPEQSPLNKPVYGVIATPRSQAGAPYSQAEIGQANSNGILLIGNPIQAGNTFGFLTGTNRAMNSNSAQGPVEYTRMTNFLIQSYGAILGQFVGQLQTQQVSDPLRAAVTNLSNNFLNELIGNGQLDAANTICTFSQTGGPGLNTPQTIAQHILNVAVQARYLSSVWFLVFNLQGGVTVQISASVITSQPQ